MPKVSLINILKTNNALYLVNGHIQQIIHTENGFHISQHKEIQVEENIGNIEEIYNKIEENFSMKHPAREELKKNKNTIF